MVDFLVNDEGKENLSTQATPDQLREGDENSSAPNVDAEPGAKNEVLEQQPPIHDNLNAQSSKSWLQLTAFGGVILIYLSLSILRIDSKYVDFGDGNYLYLSWRLTEGDLLYQDLPSPQPPLLLFLGSWLMSLAGGEAGLIRLWQVVQHILTGCCVWGIAYRLFSLPWLPTLAGAIYIFLPEGVWWSAGYQSEPLLILLQSFQLLVFLDAVKEEKPTLKLYCSAVIMAATCFVNMTAAPYLLLQWFFVWFRFRPLFPKYSIALVVPGVLFFLYMLYYSAGTYIEHVFFRQIGSYPSESVGEAFSYFFHKLVTEGGDILFYEGGFVFAAIAGIFVFANASQDLKGRDYIVWWGIFSLGSIIFVTKGGTVEYIFTLGEPAVAVFSAFFFVGFWMANDIPTRFKNIIGDPVQLGKWVLLLSLAIPALLIQPYRLLNWTLFSQTTEPGQRDAVFELSGVEVNRLAQYIQMRCPLEKTIISPPYYAFISKRKITENACELFLIYHAWFNELERFKQETGSGVDLPDLQETEFAYHSFRSTYSVEQMMQDIKSNNWDALQRRQNAYARGLAEAPYNTNELMNLISVFQQNPEYHDRYPVISMFLKMREQIISRQVGLILANTRHLFFWVPPLHQAIRDYCYPVDPPLSLPNREEWIVAYVPK